MFDCSGVMFVPLFSKKAKLSKWPKSRKNRTNMDIILSFLAKPVDKHGITLVHITYPPLNVGSDFFQFLLTKISPVASEMHEWISDL